MASTSDRVRGAMSGRRPRFTKKDAIENATSLGLALLFVLMVRSSVVEAFKIPSGSMIPTLLVGDHIFVNKFAYGLKLPLVEWFRDEPIYLIRRAPPKRGDIIVFWYPPEKAIGNTIYYIKRVVGTPGDVVEMRDKHLFINGQDQKMEPLAQDQVNTIDDSLDATDYVFRDLEMYKEHLGEAEHVTMFDKNTYMEENFGPITVPQDRLFVMGDNRDHSSDSRRWGFVPIDYVKGRAMVIWMSLRLSPLTFRPLRTGTALK